MKENKILLISKNYIRVMLICFIAHYLYFKNKLGKQKIITVQ